jgi:hypothetical protein
MSQQVLNDAERISQITGRPLDVCQQLAQDIADCVKAMKSRVVEFYFKKKDGTIRQAYGTLQDSVILPLIKDTTNREPNPELVTYFDNVKQQFRSFRKENFIRFEP